MNLRPLTSLSALLFLFSTGVALPALADAPPDPAKVAEARKAYEEGADAFSHNDYSTAVTKLQHSFDLVPSPAAELMLARALRESGKASDALTHFKSCETTAHERVEKGDARFGDTEKDCSTDGAALGAKMGTLEVSVPSAKEGTTVEVDGTATPLTNGHAEIVHDPGDVKVVVKSPGEAPVEKTVSIGAGKTTSATFDGSSSSSNTSGGSGRRKWTVPAAIASGGVAALGFGLFIGFAVKTESIWSDFNACRPRCPASLYAAKADAGAHAQTGANVSVTIASLAAVACGAFVILTLTDQSTDGTKTALGLSPLGVSLEQRF